MARIRHIALLTKDTENSRSFTKRPSVSKRSLAAVKRASTAGAIYLSDGHINLAVLPARNRREGHLPLRHGSRRCKGATQTALAAGATGGTANLPRDGRFCRDVCPRSGRHARRSVAGVESVNFHLAGRRET